jgi:hypothetical protein
MAVDLAINPSDNAEQTAGDRFMALPNVAGPVGLTAY